MRYEYQNFAFQLPRLEDGDELFCCNCQQERAYTPFGERVKGLTFERCNLINCSVPEDATVKDCNASQWEPQEIVTRTVEEQERIWIREQEIKELAAKTALTGIVPSGKTLEEALAYVEKEKDAAMTAAIAAAVADPEEEISDVSGCQVRENYDERGQLISYTWFKCRLLEYENLPKEAQVKEEGMEVKR